MIKKLEKSKAFKAMGYASFRTRAFMAAWHMERPPDLEVSTLLLGWVRDSPTLGLRWARTTTRPEAVLCKGTKLAHQREDAPCPTNSSSAKCYHKSLSHIWTPRPKGTSHYNQVCVLSRSVVSDFCNPMDCSLPGSSVHGDSPGKNTAVGSQMPTWQFSILVNFRVEITNVNLEEVEGSS